MTHYPRPTIDFAKHLLPRRRRRARSCWRWRVRRPAGRTCGSAVGRPRCVSSCRLGWSTSCRCARAARAGSRGVAVGGTRRPRRRLRRRVDPVGDHGRDAPDLPTQGLTRRGLCITGRALLAFGHSEGHDLRGPAIRHPHDTAHRSSTPCRSHRPHRRRGGPRVRQHRHRLCDEDLIGVQPMVCHQPTHARQRVEALEVAWRSPWAALRRCGSAGSPLFTRDDLAFASGWSNSRSRGVLCPASSSRHRHRFVRFPSFASCRLARPRRAEAGAVVLATGRRGRPVAVARRPMQDC